MKKRLIKLLTFILLATIIAGCNSVYKKECKVEFNFIKGTLTATYIYETDTGFNPNWSTKEGIIKIGNIGIGL